MKKHFKRLCWGVAFIAYLMWEVLSLAVIYTFGVFCVLGAPLILLFIIIGDWWKDRKGL
ncbi:MAG: hypothetical protein P8P30_10610 [Rickettsiales bacterium]|nr:hypothetical protein [Rickettsiales bacterium]